MPVDKFGRSSHSTIGGGVWQFSTGGLVHKVGDTMMGILSSGGYRITNVGAPTENADAATKGYADTIDLDNLQLAGGTMSGNINMSGHRISGLRTADTPDSDSDAVSWAQVVRYADEQADVSNAQDVIVKEYADRKDAALNTGLRLYTDQKTAAARQYTDEKSNAAKQYADEKDTLVRNAHVQKAGDTMTGNLDMGGKRVTGLPLLTTDINDAASISEVRREVNAKMTNLNITPSAPLHVTNKRYVDAAIKFTADDKDTVIRRYSDEKDVALNTTLRLYTDQKTLAAREYAKQYTDGRIPTVGTHVLKAGDTMTGNLDMGGRRVTGLPISHISRPADSDAVSMKLLSDGLKNLMTNYDMSSFPGTPIGPKFLTNKRYVDEHNAAIRGAHILKAGDTMTGDLQMSGKRITGLPEGASVSNTDGASIGQVSKMVSSAMIRLNRVPSGALNVTNKQYVDSQISLAKRYVDNKDLAARQHSVALDAIIMTYIRNLKILNHTGHIPPIPVSHNFTGFIPTASSELSTNPAELAFNPTRIADGLIPGDGWTASVNGVGSWLQIECPTAVRIWKVRLHASIDISSWKISGVVRNGAELVLTDLLTSSARFNYDQKPQDFPVDSVAEYKIYRFTALSFIVRETVDTPEQAWVCNFQIFTYFKDGD